MSFSSNFVPFVGVATSMLLLMACTTPASGGPDIPAPSVDRSDDTDVPGGLSIASAGGPLCIIDADCAAGAHCDLGECISRCGSAAPCQSGRTCSPRGLCVAPDQGHTQEMPSAVKVGQVQVSPTAVVLTEADRTLSLTLTTDSPDPVGYRIVPTAPHLSILEARGEFQGETTIELDVDRAAVHGVDIPGTVRIVTDLGELVVDAPLRVGLSGRYEGAMRYALGSAPLGDAQIVLDLEETLGDVIVSVDPQRSLLFPNLDGAPSAGVGVYTLSEGLEVTLTQRVPLGTGGERNHFARDVGREITLHVERTAQGVLEGTFEERIFGVFEQPVSVGGTVYLRTRPLHEPLQGHTPVARQMPTVVAGSLSTTAFAERTNVPDFDALGAALPTGCVAGASAASCLSNASELFYGGLGRALTAPANSTDPIGDLRTVCEAEIYDDPVAWASSAATGGGCANAGGLVAVLRELALVHAPSAEDAAALFHRTLARLLAPHLLIAQDDLVLGVRDSFLRGPSSQAELYQTARSFLSAPARLAFEPRVLEFLRRTSPAAAAGDGSDPSLQDFPALRALGRLVYVLATIEGELSSLAASDPDADRLSLLRSAQEHAVLTVLEASALAALVGHWQTVPPGLGSELLGALTPIDRGFGSLLHGAVLFGVPEGEIPLAFDPARPEPTNFEQVLLRAAPALAQQAQSQAAFLGSSRDFEQSQDTLAAELEQVRAGYEASVASICGSGFELGSGSAEPDWERCGADGSGSLAEARLAIDLRKAEVASAFGRLEGIGQRIAVEEQAAFDASRARDQTLRFLSAKGTEMAALAQMENIINAAQIALELASNASLWNVGTSVALGVASAVLETTKGTFQVRREELNMLQTIQLASETQQLAEIEAAARIKTLLIDAAQIELDMEQLDIQLLQTLIFATDLLESAKRTAVERTRVLARIQESPAADPIYRTLLHDSLLQALVTRRDAQRWLYRAGRALEYETNTPFGDALGRAVLAASGEQEMSRLTDCFLSILGDHAIEHGIPQEFRTTVSVRELLGVYGPRTDAVTGEELSPGELFRWFLLRNQNLDGSGGVAVEFSTNLEPNNGLWSSSVCSDKIVGVRAKLVGDFLGDDEAEVDLSVAGGGVLRSCTGDQLLTWAIDSPQVAVVQAGVNSFGSAAASTTLHGHSVARPKWRLSIPGPAQAPANLDLKLERIEDVVLEITHQALPLRPEARSVSLSCLAAIGAGG